MIHHRQHTCSCTIPVDVCTSSHLMTQQICDIYNMTLDVSLIGHTVIVTAPWNDHEGSNSLTEDSIVVVINVSKVVIYVLVLYHPVNDHQTIESICHIIRNVPRSFMTDD